MQLVQIRARHDETRWPGHFGLILHIEYAKVHRLGGLDLVLGEELAGPEPQHVQSTHDLGSVDVSVVPVDREVPTDDDASAVDRTTIEVRDLDWVRGISEVHDRRSALVPPLHLDVASWH